MESDTEEVRSQGGREEDEDSSSSEGSGRETPVSRCRSPSAESMRSAVSRASKRSRAREDSPNRSRSPIRGDGETKALRAENQALKKEIQAMGKIIADQKSEIDTLKSEIQALRIQGQAQHKESLGRFDALAKLLANNNSGTFVSETMEFDQPETKEPTRPAPTPQKTVTVKKTAKTMPETSEEPSTSRQGAADKDASSEKAKEPRIPPVILRNKDNWNEVSKQLKAAKINYVSKGQAYRRGYPNPPCPDRRLPATHQTAERRRPRVPHVLAP